MPCNDKICKSGWTSGNLVVTRRSSKNEWNPVPVLADSIMNTSAFVTVLIVCCCPDVLMDASGVILRVCGVP